MSTPNKVEVSQVSDVTTVEITTAGPQGPAAAGFEFNGDNKVNGSIPVYNARMLDLRLHPPIQS